MVLTNHGGRGEEIDDFCQNSQETPVKIKRKSLMIRKNGEMEQIENSRHHVFTNQMIEVVTFLMFLLMVLTFNSRVWSQKDNFGKALCSIAFFYR